ncbi:MAG: NADH:flavin oxidoreductase/NADH oxidase [Alphaproteobacteria bacterium]|nr:NADH:flavin oxidoreductase/NADH oxidase [Alphaproteobacteria bacterium]
MTKAGTDTETETPLLFSPLTLGGVTLKNRVVISPMCQYSAQDGLANDWHSVHLGQYALGGSALVFCEAAAVEARGRITHGDLGIWSAEHAAALKPITSFLRAHGAAPGMQIAHAGRKASMQRPWQGHGPLDESDSARGETAWDIVAPSAEPVSDGSLMPHEMSLEDIATVQQAFADAAGYTDDAGFEVLELHSAHGYLSHTFLSPTSNHRNDAYGGDRAGRMRFTLETVEKVRAVWPAHKPFFVRISTVDGVEGGWDVEDSIALTAEMKQRGVDVVDCSSGGIAGMATTTRDPLPLGFRLPFSDRIRRDNDIATMTHGLILHADQAEEILQAGQADLIGIARGALYNPYWARHAAHELGFDPGFDDWPDQYGWWLTRREAHLKSIGAR